MANPTSNFGWQMPTNTDLVKDLPADFEVFGQAVDTSLMDLKGGTTGQVLSKASNTDMDFTWVAQDDSNAIQNALLTTTGDTIYASGASTPARLGIGTSGQVLTVSGGIPSWATPSSGSLTLLSTTSLSGATTTISGISGAHTHLFAYVYGVTNATSDGELYVNPNGASNLATAAGSNVDTGSTATARGYRQGSLYFNFALTVTRTNATNGFYLFIYNYANTTAIKPFQVGGSFNSPTAVATQYNGAIHTTSAITSLVFANTGGNLSTGTVLLYGVK